MNYKINKTLLSLKNNIKTLIAESSIRSLVITDYFNNSSTLNKTKLTRETVMAAKKATKKKVPTKKMAPKKTTTTAKKAK